MEVEFARQIGTDAASTPKLRVVVFGLPWFGRRAETAYIRRERPDLLRVTVGAAFASIDNSAPLFGGGERWHGDWSHLFDFSFQFFSGKDGENKKRKREETYTCTEGDDMCIAEPIGREECG